ncbi:hypothetical protein [Thermococcus sp.]|uniref:hypothetical protein n=1 Tax=Thermococcus sp. TaxID=35749 RepID=UPI0019836DFC|nr:hypothetical protein [Thermococcus sp.]MBC7094465.1 hypothetical protein [Thermococcus sp.]
MSNNIELSRLCGIVERESKKLRELPNAGSELEKEALLNTLNTIEGALAKISALKPNGLDFKANYVALQTDISNLRTSLEKSNIYGREYFKRQAQYLADKLDALLVKIKPKGFLPTLAEFIAKHPQFSENWAVAMCYIGAMEVALNRFLEEFNVDLEELGVQKHGTYDYTFADKYYGFVKYLNRHGIYLPKLEAELPKIFYSIRNKVVHEGYSPNDRDLEFIIEYSERVIDLIENVENKLNEVRE